MPLLPVAARWSNFFEKYVLSLLFLKIAYDKATAAPALIQGLQAGPTEFAAVMLNLLVFLYALFFALNLLASRKPVRNPTSWHEIVIPLIATFVLYAFTALAPLVPEPATRNLLPLSLQRDAAVTAMLVSLAGYAIALWSVAYLGRSLAVVVSVRTLVLGGPYRYVRHPMYLGYVFLVTGMLIASASVYAGVLLVTYLLLTVYRARLEEQALCSYSDEYRRYAARTGFLFPALGALGREGNA